MQLNDYCLNNLDLLYIKTVGNGNFLAASFNSIKALFLDIWLNSKREQPAFIRKTQYSTAPLPLPIRISFGFRVTGISVKPRIHNFSFFLIVLVIFCFAAFSCFTVKRALLRTFNPNTP